MRIRRPKPRPPRQSPIRIPDAAQLPRRPGTGPSRPVDWTSLVPIRAPLRPGEEVRMITPPRRQPPRRVRVPLRDFDAPGFVGSPDHLSGGSPRAALPRPLPFPNLDRPQRPPWEGVLNPGALGDQFDLSGDVMDALMALLQRRYLGGRAE